MYVSNQFEQLKCQLELYVVMYLKYQGTFGYLQYLSKLVHNKRKLEFVVKAGE